MPLNEDEQRILAQIERQFLADDEDYAKRMSGTTLRTYLARNCRWSVAGFVVGLVVLVTAFAYNPVIGVVGFLLMVASTVTLVQTVRKISRIGIAQAAQSVRAVNLTERIDELNRRIRRRFGRAE